MKWKHRVGRRLKLRELNVLLAVAQAGSMAKAGRDMAISQSAISRAIADIEHTLGVPLFDRTPQGIELTQYGRSFLNRTIAVFDELNQGVQDIEFLADPTTGELRIGTAPGLAEGVVLAVVNRLSRKYPRVVFHIVQHSPGVDDVLRERRVELAFGRTGTSTLEEDLNAEILFEDSLAAVAGVRNPLLRRRKIKLAELANEPWTWPAQGTDIDALMSDAFRASGIEPPRATVYADAINMRTRLAATGPYIAVIPASIMKFPGKSPLISVLPVTLPTTQRQIGIFTLKNRTLSPLAQVFIECAREVARPSAHGR